jgi:hypothetical protein
MGTRPQIQIFQRPWKIVALWEHAHQNQHSQQYIVHKMFVLEEGAELSGTSIGVVRTWGIDKDYLQHIFSSDSEWDWSLAGLWWDSRLARRIASKTETATIYYKTEGGYTHVWIC